MISKAASYEFGGKLEGCAVGEDAFGTSSATNPGDFNNTEKKSIHQMNCTAELSMKRRDMSDMMESMASRKVTIDAVKLDNRLTRQIHFE